MAKKTGEKINSNTDQKEKKMETNETETATATGRAVIPATTAYNLTQEQIDNAIQEGWIVANPEPVDVTIKADSSPTKKDEVQPYMQLLGITWEGMVLLSGGKAEPQAPRGDDKVDSRSEAEKAKGAPDHFNYGLDLEVKRALRRGLEQEISGPAKVIERAAKALFDAKLFGSLEAARAHVKAQRTELGLDA